MPSTVQMRQKDFQINETSFLDKGWPKSRSGEHLSSLWNSLQLHQLSNMLL